MPMMPNRMSAPGKSKRGIAGVLKEVFRYSEKLKVPVAVALLFAVLGAILTIIGYTINDTVVVFDRIREYLVLYPKRDLRENVNNALNATLSRTINTSGTTLVTLLAILFFGGETIRGFIFALVLGVVVGTLSTLFVATPIAYGLMKREGLGKK